MAGGPLKEAGTTHWDSPNTSATNKTGFSALPGGYRNNSGDFYSIFRGDYGCWWSATEYGAPYADYFDLYSDSANLHWTNGLESSGFSVRLLRDP